MQVIGYPINSTKLGRLQTISWPVPIINVVIHKAAELSWYAISSWPHIIYVTCRNEHVKQLQVKQNEVKSGDSWAHKSKNHNNNNKQNNIDIIDHIHLHLYIDCTLFPWLDCEWLTNPPQYIVLCYLMFTLNTL